MRVGRGQDLESWSLHRSLLTHHSPHFATGLTETPRGSRLHTIKLPEDDPDAFALFVQWLYTGRIAARRDKLPAVVCHAWVLGEKLQCPAFQDRVMCRLLACHVSEALNEETVQLIYEISPAGSLLRAFAVDQFFWNRGENTSVPPQIGVAGVMAVVDFNKDLLERLCDNDTVAVNPYEDGMRYMNVLDYGVGKVK